MLRNCRLDLITCLATPKRSTSSNRIKASRHRRREIAKFSTNNMRFRFRTWTRKINKLSLTTCNFSIACKFPVLPTSKMKSDWSFRTSSNCAQTSSLTYTTVRLTASKAIWPLKPKKNKQCKAYLSTRKTKEMSWLPKPRLTGNRGSDLVIKI